MPVWRKMLSAAAATVDEAMLAAMNARGARERQHTASMSHEQRLVALAEVHDLYGGAIGEGPAAFFPHPPEIEPQLREVRAGAWEATFASPFVPYLAATATKYLSNVENRTARARLYFAPFRHARPVIIAVHGYMGGHWLLEEAQWPLAWLQRIGMDVALPLLPFHGSRAGARSGPPQFPSSDPRFTNEGFRQAVTDIVALANWLRRRGAPSVGIMGMSLGGYTSALVATVSDAIDFVMPMIPLASIADFAREQGSLGIGENANLQHQALERANWVVSPLARPLRLPVSRALVVAAEHDRITPSSHAARLAKHFDCDLLTMAGGHLVQLGRGDAFRGLRVMLEREGILPRHAPK